MDFELHVVRGRSAAQAIKLADGVNSVGRHDDCTVRIKSSQVSRKHCELFEKQGKLVLKDLGSANGTFVNGQKVEGQRVLEPGDELNLGGIKLRVAKVGQAPPAPQPAKAPSDTAVVEAVAPSGGGGDDEFEIDFEDEVVSAVGDEAVEFDLDEELSGPPPAPAAAPSPAKAPASASAPPKVEPAPPPKAPEPAPATESADEAIADFLLDIKVDDEE